MHQSPTASCRSPSKQPQQGATASRPAHHASITHQKSSKQQAANQTSHATSANQGPNSPYSHLLASELGLPVTTHCALLTVGCLICRSACCGCLLWLFAGASARGGGWYACCGWMLHACGMAGVVSACCGCLMWLLAGCLLCLGACCGCLMVAGCGCKHQRQLRSRFAI